MTEPFDYDDFPIPDRKYANNLVSRLVGLSQTRILLTDRPLTPLQRA
ncbi:MAG: hypothetical protein QXF26_05155 [Candidatus Bathyarchaeia archaeon]